MPASQSGSFTPQRWRLATRLEAEPSTPIDELALVLAEEDRPSVDVGACRSTLDDLASDVDQERARTACSLEEALRVVFGQRWGFQGNATDYYEPQNSYLDAVLDRRTGIPISLAAVLLGVCRRLDEPAAGIGFPGHFLVRLGQPKHGTFVDPFDGARRLGNTDLRTLLAKMFGREVALHPRYLSPVGPRTMLMRMLVNLKMIHIRAGERARAMLMCDRLLELGADSNHLRDRGLLALSLGATAAGVADLHSYVSSNPEPEDAEKIRGVIAANESPHPLRSLN